MVREAHTIEVVWFVKLTFDARSDPARSTRAIFDCFPVFFFFFLRTLSFLGAMPGGSSGGGNVTYVDARKGSK